MATASGTYFLQISSNSLEFVLDLALISLFVVKNLESYFPFLISLFNFESYFRNFCHGNFRVLLFWILGIFVSLVLSGFGFGFG